MNNVLKTSREYQLESYVEDHEAWWGFLTFHKWEEAKESFLKHKDFNPNKKYRLVRIETTVMMESHPGG